MDEIPIVKTIKEAKELSLKKWHDIINELYEIRGIAISTCGFCYYSIHIELEKEISCNDCPICPVENTCLNTVGITFIKAISNLIDINKRIIDDIRNVKEDS
ncbi:hypothetical protein ES702_01457 [subsurface metagenome]